MEELRVDPGLELRGTKDDLGYTVHRGRPEGYYAGVWQDEEWVGRFQDRYFDGFENEAQALRWVVKQMYGTYQVALRQTIELGRLVDSYQEQEKRQLAERLRRGFAGDHPEAIR